MSDRGDRGDRSGEEMGIELKKDTKLMKETGNLLYDGDDKSDNLYEDIDFSELDKEFKDG